MLAGLFIQYSKYLCMAVPTKVLHRTEATLPLGQRCTVISKNFLPSQISTCSRMAELIMLLQYYSLKKISQQIGEAALVESLWCQLTEISLEVGEAVLVVSLCCQQTEYQSRDQAGCSRGISLVLTERKSVLRSGSCSWDNPIVYVERKSVQRSGRLLSG